MSDLVINQNKDNMQNQNTDFKENIKHIESKYVLLNNEEAKYYNNEEDEGKSFISENNKENKISEKLESNKNQEETEKEDKLGEQTEFPDFSHINYSSKYNLKGYSESIAYDNKMNYTFFEKNRYYLPKFIYQENEYYGICNNGFIKLRTLEGNSYWLSQNENNHTTPDFKFHISVINKDIKKAWNLIVSLYIYKQCWEGCKVSYVTEGDIEKGREITIYIFKYDKEIDIGIHKERSQNFWYDFFICAEHILKRNCIRSNGCAEGDLPLGEYISIRNEAFILDPIKDVYVYPPNKEGWNHCNHTPPFDLERFVDVNKVSISNLIKNKKNSNGFFPLVLKLSVILLIWSYFLIRFINWRNSNK